MHDERYLCFTLGTGSYAIPLLFVKEVIGNVQTTPIPQAPAHFKGIMNLRGQVISVIDLRQKLKIQKKSESAEETIVIVDVQSVHLGFIVDSVDRVAMWDPSHLSPPPELQGPVGKNLILNVAKEAESMTLILNLPMVLDAEDFNSANQHSKKTA